MLLNRQSAKVPKATEFTSPVHINVLDEQIYVYG